MNSCMQNACSLTVSKLVEMGDETKRKISGSSGIWTHNLEETVALNHDTFFRWIAQIEKGNPIHSF